MQASALHSTRYAAGTRAGEWITLLRTRPTQGCDVMNARRGGAALPNLGCRAPTSLRHVEKVSLH